MLATSGRLEAALMDVVQRAGMGSGLPIRFALIAQEWNRIGLRASELRDAVRELVERRYATCTQQDGQLAIAPTPSGLRRLAESEDE
ncbi:MAG TPA: hypothetical protein VHE37_16485 [Nevskiaceae bacterium]|nr:hypothetical protein [Nevskiaceae bacterium]